MVKDKVDMSRSRGDPTAFLKSQIALLGEIQCKSN